MWHVPDPDNKVWDSRSQKQRDFCWCSLPGCQDIAGSSPAPVQLPINLVYAVTCSVYWDELEHQKSITVWMDGKLIWHVPDPGKKVGHRRSQKQRVFCGATSHGCQGIAWSSPAPVHMPDNLLCAVTLSVYWDEAGTPTALNGSLPPSVPVKKKGTLATTNSTVCVASSPHC